ncbi:phenylalanyl-tRNA synthetase alpha chain [Culex quinquefasciatus]|uniref:Phenylalanyl-tRNA synthetase alpha chain n=1 Tax=Culex quinquefasciatus TaxID=7176 RepID=B0WXP2_CULQU|nr:phenylalanyl-tRNA synthetase alpha chain [Culex quinquefasciatus]|eukprot:XP_001862166.1 phenylalanyl-tRNA synthetase alpha chain [Culex quinquefasciatus]
MKKRSASCIDQQGTIVDSLDLVPVFVLEHQKIVGGVKSIESTVRGVIQTEQDTRMCWELNEEGKFPSTPGLELTTFGLRGLTFTSLSDGRRDQTNLVSKNSTGTFWDQTKADWWREISSPVQNKQRLCFQLNNRVIPDRTTRSGKDRFPKRSLPYIIMKEKLVDMRYWPLTAGKNNDPTAGALSLASLLNTLLGDKLKVIAGGERDYYLCKKVHTWYSKEMEKSFAFQFTTTILRPFQIVLNGLSGVTEAHKSTPYKTIAGRSKTQTRLPVHAKWFMCYHSLTPHNPALLKFKFSHDGASPPEFLKKAAVSPTRHGQIHGTIANHLARPGMEAACKPPLLFYSRKRKPAELISSVSAQETDVEPIKVVPPTRTSTRRAARLFWKDQSNRRWCDGLTHVDFEQI